MKLNAVSTTAHTVKRHFWIMIYFEFSDRDFVSPLCPELIGDDPLNPILASACMSGSLVTATPASSFTSIGLSTATLRAIGLSVEIFKFTLSVQPNNVKPIAARSISFPLRQSCRTLFIKAGFYFSGVFCSGTPCIMSCLGTWFKWCFMDFNHSSFNRACSFSSLASRI